jgi:AraC-like DNA-binding protein
MTELIRVAALTGYLQTMAALGADPLPLLKETGLSKKSLSKPEAMVSALAALRLLDRSADVTGCRTFGLRMSPNRGLADFGVTSLLLEHEANLGQALLAYSKYRILINPTSMVHFEDIGDAVLIRQNFTLVEAQLSQQAIDLALAALVRLAFLVSGDDWQPEMVCFTAEAPPPNELPIYRRIFQCRVEFNAECNGIVIASRDLDRPCLRADSGLAEHARKLIEATMQSETAALSQQVLQAILLLMPSGHATIQACSDLLGVTVRTLQRALDADGTCFTSMLNDARIRMAAQYLANPSTRITDIAGMLGYRSTGAFTRWHQKNVGTSPARRRRSATSTRRADVITGRS